MTTEEALSLLDAATARLHLTREDHVKVQTALQVLRSAVTPQSGDVGKAATEAKKK